VIIEVPAELEDRLAANAEVLALLLVQKEVCEEKATPSF
jgi:hypothetical protein